MSLSRKHYVKVASILSEQMTASFPNLAGMEAVQNIAIEFEAWAKADNPRFEANTFFDAASVRCFRCSNWSHLATEKCGNA